MKILLLGATGLVGGEVLKLALAHQQVTHIIAPVRKGLNISHPKLNDVVINFDDFAKEAQEWQFDAVICALGTTMKKAKSKEAFKKIDYDYPMAFARLAQQKGVQNYVLNSALGANAKSPFFYSRTKGQLEQDLQQLGFQSISFIRPGLIQGDRAEFRLGEYLANKVLAMTKPILPKQWQANQVQDIAMALLNTALAANQGLNIIEAKDIHRI